MKLLTRKHAGWMAPLWVDGDGYDGVAAGRRASNKGYLPMQLDKYLQLLDEVGRDLAPGKSRGDPGGVAAHPGTLGPGPRAMGRGRCEGGEAFRADRGEGRRVAGGSETPRAALIARSMRG